MTHPTEPRIAELFSRAQAHQRKSQFQPASLLYQEILALAPDHVDSIEGMGLMACQEKNLPLGVEYFDRMIRVQPSHVGAHCNRGNALKLMGQVQAALQSFERATALDPRNAVAYYSSAECYRDLGRTEEALVSYDRARALDPGFVQAIFRHGLLLQEIERLEEASDCYARVLRIQPNHLNSLANQALALSAIGRGKEAIVCCDALIGLQPDQSALYSLRGKLLGGLGKWEAALESYDRAATLSPNNPEAHHSVGQCLMLMGRLRDAIPRFDRAINLKPDYVESYNCRALSARTLGRYSAATTDFKMIAGLAPEFPFLPGARLESSLPICDWADYEALLAQVIAGVRANEQVVHPFLFMALSDCTSLQLAAARVWAQHACPPNKVLGPIAPRLRRQRLTVGYFSADLGANHPVGRLIVEVVERHDRQKFEVIAFSSDRKGQEWAQRRLEHAVDRFIDVGKQSNVEVARLARNLNVDIAVDLGGYTQDSRPEIMALRAAPVQIGYLGYLGTTGASYMDYILADGIVITADSERNYSEKVIYLPDTHQANPTARHVADKVFTRKELRLPSRGFVFCCFNTTYKLSPATFAGWMRILRAVRDSVLLLYADHESTVHNLRAQAQQCRVNPDRVVFGDRMPPALYLARLRVADLFLDTFPYNAGTTASDALWCGVPVLTMAGESFASRIAASLLTSLGVPELITTTPQQYEQLAIELGSNPKRYLPIRARVEANRSTSTLFDTSRFTGHLEAALTAAHARHQAGLPPDHIRV